MSRPVSLCLLLALLIALRVSAPSDLMEGAQSKQVGYVMDVLLQRHWLLQYEINGEVATKPPLYNWCAAAICEVCGTEAEWAMKLPSLLAGVGLLCCVYWLARHYFDARVAFYAVVAGITSHHFSKLAWFARTDMLMTFLVYLGIVMQLAWQPGWRRTIWISLIMAACALTKGPTGPLLYLLFLAWWCWENQAWERSAAWKHFFCRECALPGNCGAVGRGGVADAGISGTGHLLAVRGSAGGPGTGTVVHAADCVSVHTDCPLAGAGYGGDLDLEAPTAGLA